jgi:hypothetical protein
VVRADADGARRQDGEKDRRGGERRAHLARAFD